MKNNGILLNYLDEKRGEFVYQIAICDDEINVCSQLEENINRYFREHYLEGETDIFYSGEMLCEHLRNNKSYNLIFLDIELNKINGIEVGNYIRNELQDEITDLIYLSHKTSYALELFKLRPLDFIIKPITYYKIENILDVVLRRNKIREIFFEFQCNKVVQKVLLKHIIYFKSENKNIYIILCSGEEKVFKGKLEEVEKRLPDWTFLRIHKSFLINYDFVQQYSYEWVKMTNGDILNISRAHRKVVKNQLINHEILQ